MGSLEVTRHLTRSTVWVEIPHMRPTSECGPWQHMLTTVICFKERRLSRTGFIAESAMHSNINQGGQVPHSTQVRIKLYTPHRAHPRPPMHAVGNPATSRAQHASSAEVACPASAACGRQVMMHMLCGETKW